MIIPPSPTAFKDSSLLVRLPADKGFPCIHCISSMLIRMFPMLERILRAHSSLLQEINRIDISQQSMQSAIW